MPAHLLIILVSALAALGVVVRPFGWPEAIWAVGGVVALTLARAVAPADVVAGLAKSVDVILFLAGMMLLSEIAKGEGLFDWLAALATDQARGSPRRLFLLIYGVGATVTVFLSNDATAVVLTPAVAAAAKAARAPKALPYVLVCAFVANAASFVLPISNPANLVIYGADVPPLFAWIKLYLPASLLSAIATFYALRFAVRSDLRGEIASDIRRPKLSRGGKLAAFGICAAALVLLVVSALGARLGLPTALAGSATLLVVCLSERRSPWPALRDMSWSVLLLVAGLFVLVEALQQSGALLAVTSLLSSLAKAAPGAAVWTSSAAVALASNLMNNLPVAMIASSLASGGRAQPEVVRSLLIGVDLGPNLSVTGSLATVLWLAALRRENIIISASTFLKYGLIVMPPALVLALGAAALFG